MDEHEKEIRHLQWENELLRDRKNEICTILEMGKEKIWKYRVFSIGISGFCCFLLTVIFFLSRKHKNG